MAKKKHHSSHRGHHGHHSKPHHSVHHSHMDHAEHYAGMEPRRRQEMEDAGMIHEDHRAIANLPQEVMIKPYADSERYLPEVLDDTIHGIDKQIDYDDNKRREHFSPKKV